MQVKLRYWWHEHAINDRCCCCEAQFVFNGQVRGHCVDDRTYALARTKCVNAVQAMVRALPVYAAPPANETIEVT